MATLPAVTGAYGRRGGGALLLTAGSMDFNFSFVRKPPSGQPTARLVNQLRLGEELMSMDGPPLRGIFIAANNPAVTCPDAGRVRQGLSRDDLFVVVHDPFMTDTARYADIVLPATTYLETSDFYRGYGNYYMQFSPRAVSPQADAWSNFRLAQALATRMGITDPVFRMSPDEILPEFFRGATGIVADVAPASLMAGRPIKVRPADGQEFRTGSGRLEIYSQALLDQGVSPLPDWQPDAIEAAEAARWPLRLLTAPSYFQPHTAYSGVTALRKREGEPFCVLHPTDAAQRELAAGQKVRLLNDRAAIGLVLRIGDEVQPGVVLVSGQRPSSEAVDGTVNMLCSTRLTDIGKGACYQSTFLDVEAWEPRV